MQAPVSVNEGKENNFVKAELVKTILHKGLGSEGVLWHRENDDAKIEVYRIPAGTSKIILSGIIIPSHYRGFNNDSHEVKYFVTTDDKGKVHNRNSWIVAAVCSTDDVSSERLSVVSDYRLNVCEYNDLEQTYMKSRENCTGECVNCAKLKECVYKYNNDISYEFNIDSVVFENNGNNDVFLFVFVLKEANLSVQIPHEKENSEIGYGEIKRIEELEMIPEESPSLAAISGIGIGSEGNIHTAQGEKIYVFEIPAGTRRIGITGIQVWGRVRDGGKFQRWIVAGLSTEKRTSLSDGDVVSIMPQNRFKVEDYNKLTGSNIGSPQNIELYIDKKNFENNKNQSIYLYVCVDQNAMMNVQTFKIDSPNELYFEEEPVAEAITDGDLLSQSRIFLGSVVNNGNLIEKGICLWEKPQTKVLDNGKDYQEFKAIFYKPLHPRFLEQDVKFFRKHQNYLVAHKREFKKRLLRYFRVGWFMLPVPVYAKSDHRFDTLVWSKNLLSSPSSMESNYIANKGEYSRKNLSQYTSHHQYKDVLESFSLMEIFSSYDDVANKKPEDFAKEIIRNIVRQPKGRRSITFDQGNDILSDLMGGAIRIADTLKAREKNNNRTPEEFRLMKDYLYSMVYFENEDTDSTDELCGDGYFFYDAPIHINNPKTKTKPEGFDCYINIIKTLFCNPNVHKEGECVNENISSCEAFSNLMEKIFKEVHKYGVEIDYVYHDFEMMHNTAVNLKNANRFPAKEDATDSSVWMKLWNSLNRNDEDCPYRNIRSKISKRGFVVLDSSAPLSDVAISDVNRYGYFPYPSEPSQDSPVRCRDGAYIRRRNVNIWDDVALEYSSSLFEKFMMEPIRKYSPNMRCSVHITSEHKGCYHVSDEFEKSLGGNIRLPPKMDSTPCLYGNRSNSIFKKNLYNWKTLPGLTSPFGTLVTSVNLTRAAFFSNASKLVMPFICSSYYWTWLMVKDYSLVGGKISEIERSQDEAKDTLIAELYEICNEKIQKEINGKTIECDAPKFAAQCCKYYREMLLHSWLSNPELMYVYLNYNDHRQKDDAKNFFDHFVFKQTNSKEYTSFEKIEEIIYNQNAYQHIQSVINEERILIETIIGKQRKAKLITNTLASETDPFFITGVCMGKFRLYRFSVSDEFNVEVNGKDVSQIKKYDITRILRFRRPHLRPAPLHRFVTPKLRLQKIQNLNFRINGKNVLFQKAIIVNPSHEYENEPGFWILSTSRCAPVITTDKDYYLKNPSWEINDFRSVNISESNDFEKIIVEKDPKRGYDVLRIAKPNLVTVFGEPAKKQKISAKVNFETQSGAKFVLNNAIGDDVFKPKRDYCLERSFDLNKYYHAKMDGCGVYTVVDSPISCEDVGYKEEVPEIDAVTSCARMALNVSREDIPFDSKPIDYLNIYKNDNGSYEEFEECVKSANFKAYIQGMNFRVDVFRDSDGINVVDMDKYYSEEDMKVMRSCPEDMFYLKVSWLNATENDEKYEVFFRPHVIGKFRYPRRRIPFYWLRKRFRKFSQTFTIPAGDEGYRILKYRRFNKRIDCIDVCVKHDNDTEVIDTVVFFPKLHSIKTLTGMGIGSDGTLYHQQIETIKTEVFKIPAGTSQITIYGLDVFSRNSTPATDPEEIKYYYNVDEKGKVHTRDKWIVATLSPSEELSCDEKAVKKIQLIPNYRINVDDFKKAEANGVSNPMTIKIDEQLQKQDTYLFVGVAKKATVSIKLN